MDKLPEWITGNIFNDVCGDPDGNYIKLVKIERVTVLADRYLVYGSSTATPYTLFKSEERKVEAKKD